MKNLLSAKEVKDKLGLDIKIIYKLMKLKSFPAIMIGGTYRVDEDELDKWVKLNLGKKIYLEED